MFPLETARLAFSLFLVSLLSQANGSYIFTMHTSNWHLPSHLTIAKKANEHILQCVILFHVFFFLLLLNWTLVKPKVFVSSFQRTGEWDVFIKVPVWHLLCARRHSGHRGCRGTDGSAGAEMPLHQAQSSTPSKHTLVCFHFHTHILQRIRWLASDGIKVPSFCVCLFSSLHLTGRRAVSGAVLFNN